jgi:hypothetical protein
LATRLADVAIKLRYVMSRDGDVVPDGATETRGGARAERHFGTERDAVVGEIPAFARLCGAVDRAAAEVDRNVGETWVQGNPKLRVGSPTWTRWWTL